MSGKLQQKQRAHRRPRQAKAGQGRPSGPFESSYHRITWHREQGSHSSRRLPLQIEVKRRETRKPKQTKCNDTLKGSPQKKNRYRDHPTVPQTVLLFCIECPLLGTCYSRRHYSTPELTSLPDALRHPPQPTTKMYITSLDHLPLPSPPSATHRPPIHASTLPCPSTTRADMISLAPFALKPAHRPPLFSLHPLLFNRRFSE